MRTAQYLMVAGSCACPGETGIGTLISLLAIRGLDRVFVLDERGRCAGVLSAEDLMSADDPSPLLPRGWMHPARLARLEVRAPHATAADLMRPQTAVLRPDDDEARIALVFLASGATALPVMSPWGEVIGAVLRSTAAGRPIEADAAEPDRSATILPFRARHQAATGS